VLPIKENENNNNKQNGEKNLQKTEPGAVEEVEEDEGGEREGKKWRTKRNRCE